MLNILPFRHQRNLNFSSLDDTRQLHSTLSTLIFKHFSVWRGSHSACISTIHAALKRQKFLVSIISSTWIILECFFAFFSLRAGNVAFVEKEQEKKQLKTSMKGKQRKIRKRMMTGRRTMGEKNKKKVSQMKIKINFHGAIRLLLCVKLATRQTFHVKKSQATRLGCQNEIPQFYFILTIVCTHSTPCAWDWRRRKQTSAKISHIKMTQHNRAYMRIANNICRILLLLSMLMLIPFSISASEHFPSFCAFLYDYFADIFIMLRGRSKRKYFVCDTAG